MKLKSSLARQEFQTPQSVLLIGASQLNEKWRLAWLKLSMYECVSAETLLAASQQLKKRSFQWIIIEEAFIVAQPSKVSKWVQQHADSAFVVMGKNALATRTWMVELGAQDYFLKRDVSAPFLDHVLQQSWARKQTEGKLKEACDELTIRGSQLEAFAHTDGLTALANRLYFYQTAETLLENALLKNKKYALLYLDLCNFKQINDCYGHHIGDEILITTAQRIHRQVPHKSLVARLSSDEFVVLVELEDTAAQSYDVAEKIMSSIKSIISVTGHELHIQARMGIATFPEATGIDALLRCAEIALSESRETAPKVILYTRELEAKYRQRTTIEASLVQAFQNQEFYVVYQPVFDAHSSATGIEALLRWNSQSLCDISAEEFFAIVDDLEINQRLCEFVTREAGKAFNQMNERGLHLTTLSINVTARQFLWEDFAEYFLGCLQDIQVSPHHVMLEITERQAINHFHICRVQLHRLKSAGIRIALDDYGTGFSSITHLKQLPVDTLKLDQSLISQAAHDADRNKELSAGVVKMAHRLGLSVVAEGIETEDEYNSLREVGCDYFQGYYLGRPMVMDDLIHYLQQKFVANPLETLSAIPMRKML